MPLRCAQEIATFRDNETIKQNDFFPRFATRLHGSKLVRKIHEMWENSACCIFNDKNTIHATRMWHKPSFFSLPHPSLMHYLVSLSRQLNSSVRKQMPTLSIFINDSKISNHFKGCFSGTINRQKTQSTPKCPFCSAFFSINIFYS